ncbi:hypothetical protein SLEP1_g35205 [Rubroshorea leprosula]|uniref:Uncharacterized protein n=1 Tax=Rubroshorea leprosula TaxID=152421 RepID=A0AAV5KMP1_9ROSI|nr:hypothetical protein SLEP1_g35205 [Rubroshorea leprosula]
MKAVKEKAANVGASAISGLEKTKATLEEKVEKMATSDEVQKGMATEMKETRVKEAELNKREAREHNAAARHAGGAGGYTVSGTGAYTGGTRN